MPIFSEGRVLPAASRADRKIAAASSRHCTIHSVMGDGAGVHIQSESKLEFDHQSILFSRPDTLDVREQVRFTFGRRGEHKHTFDMLVVKASGERVACTVKPAAKLSSGDFIDHMQVVAWWVQEKKFASSVRLLTDKDIDHVALHNANINAALRDADPVAEDATRKAAQQLRGAISIKALTDENGLQARGYRAALRLISKGDLQPVRHERITPETLVQWKELDK